MCFWAVPEQILKKSKRRFEDFLDLLWTKSFRICCILVICFVHLLDDSDSVGGGYDTFINKKHSQRQFLSNDEYSFLYTEDSCNKFIILNPHPFPVQVSCFHLQYDSGSLMPFRVYWLYCAASVVYSITKNRRRNIAELHQTPRRGIIFLFQEIIPSCQATRLYKPTRLFPP